MDQIVSPARRPYHRHGHCRGGRTTPEYTSHRSLLRHRAGDVCPEWAGPDGFAAFLACLGPKPSPQHRLTRPDLGRPYGPGNACWALPREAARYHPGSRRLTFDGLTLSMAEWADRVGLPKATLERRLNAPGWSLARALSEPSGPRRSRSSAA